jgi:general secretion pathway protein L
MSTFRAFVESLSRWIDRVAAIIVDVGEDFRARRPFQLIEQKDGSFVLRENRQSDGFDTSVEPFQIVEGRVDATVSAKLAEVLRGAQVDFLLQPNRFMVRVLELPRRASDFLEGIVRAQIDRLTPWSAADAAFGWHPSTEAGNERIAVTIVATSRTSITPFIDAAAALGADLIVVSAGLQEPLPDAAAIKICEQKIARQLGLRRTRRALIGLLAAGSAIAAASIAANTVIGGMIEARSDELTSRISERRAALQQGHDRASDAVLELERRKHATPSSAIIIEALSRVLPDDTYLTELRILGDKVQIVGVSKDAPSLIRLIEQTHHFSRAAFFAPTTRSPTETGEHFSIEAHIEPVYTPGL